MKDNFYDLVNNKVFEIIEGASGQVADFFKGAKPYGKQPMTDEEMMRRFNTLSLDEKIKIIERLGGQR